MANEIVPREQQFENVKKFLTSPKAMEGLAMALPKHITKEKMARVAITAILRTPDLLKCTPVSIMDAVLQASQLGLLPDGVLGHGYILPYKNNKTGLYSAVFIPGYKGLMDLARRGGEIAWLQARIAYENDDFGYSYGMDNRLWHVPARANGKEPGKFLAAYAVAKFKTGEFQFEVMYRDQVEAIRKKSRGGESGAWVSDWDAMALKTVIRRLCKFLPLNPEYQAAITVGEYVEAGVLDDYLETAEEGAPLLPEEPKSPLDALTDNLTGSPTDQTGPSSRSDSQLTILSDESPDEEPGSSPEDESKTGKSTSGTSTKNGGENGGVASEPPSDSDPQLPFVQAEAGKISRDEDANFIAAVENLKEKMRKVADEELIHKTVMNRLGVFGAERALEIRSREDRKRFYKELRDMYELWVDAAKLKKED